MVTRMARGVAIFSVSLVLATAIVMLTEALGFSLVARAE